MGEHVVLSDHSRSTTSVPLRRNGRFHALWTGAAAANLGLEAVEVAYPLLILSLTGSPALAGLFGFIQVGTIILVGLPAGVLVDRWDRRTVLLAAEAVRAVALGSVVLALLGGGVGVGHLLVVAVILGSGTAFGATARMLLIRAVVPAEQLTTALSRDEMRSGAAALAGPPLGGALYAAAKAYPFVAALAGFVISFVCAFAVRVPPVERPVQEAAAKADGDPWAPIATVFSGLRDLLGQRLLRATLFLISTFYFSLSAAVLAVVVSLRERGASSGTIGLALSGMAVGMLAGAFLVPRLNQLFRPGVLLVAAAALSTVSIGLLALPGSAWWVFGLLFTAALGLPALKILVDVLIFRQTPEHRRGRAISATITLIGVGSPIGSLVGGVGLQLFGVTGTLLLIAAIQAAALAGAVNRHVASARWPGPAR